MWNGLRSFDFVATCKKNTQTSEGFVSLLGLFIMMSTFFNINIIAKDIQVQYETMVTSIFVISVSCSSLLISYPLWSEERKKSNLLPIFWNIVMFVVLICFSFLIVLISNFSEIQLMVFMVNVIIISSLCNWHWALINIITGVCITLFYYIGYLAAYHLDYSFAMLEFKIAYLIFLITSTLIIFLKPKQEYLEATKERAEELAEETEMLKKEKERAGREFQDLANGLDFLENKFKEREGELRTKEIYLRNKLKLMRIEVGKAKEMKDEFIRNIAHESNTPMVAILSLSEVLYSYYDTLDNGKIKSTLKDIVNGGDRLKTYVNNIADLSKLTSLTYELHPKELNLSKLIKERTVLYKKIFSDDAKQEFKFKMPDELIISCDEYYITQVLDNLIKNAVDYGKKNPITITLRKNEYNEAEFKIIDQGIGIPIDELYTIFNTFTVSSTTRSPAKGRGVGLALCEKIIKAHKGFIKAESDGVSGSHSSLLYRYKKWCGGEKKINLRTIFARQKVGVAQVDGKIWLVHFISHELGYFVMDVCRVEPTHNPFGIKLLPMSPVYTT